MSANQPQRHLLTVAGGLVAAAAVAPALAQNQVAAPPVSGALRDPAHKYPKPPFLMQQQPYEPGENIIDYAATKGAIIKLLAKKGVRVKAVAPGPVWTPLQVSGGQPPEKLACFGGETPMGRPGQPAELAPLYVTWASEGASFTTSQVFGATGGHGGP